MPQGQRPLLITIIAAVNLLAGLIGGAVVAANAYVNFSQSASPLQSPPPEPAINPQIGPPRMQGPDGVLSTLTEASPRTVIDRPSMLSESPHRYFRERQRFLIRQIATYELYVLAFVPLAALLAMLLIGSGIGLRRMNSAGRRLAICYALLAPLVLGGSAAYNFVIVVPELERWETYRESCFRYLNEQPPPQSAVQVAYAGEALLLFFGIVWPLVLLGALSRPSVGQMFRNGRPSSANLPIADATAGLPTVAGAAVCAPPTEPTPSGS